MITRLLCSALLLVSLTDAAAQFHPDTLTSRSQWRLFEGIEPNSIDAHYVSEGILVDGMLNEPAWSRALWSNPFVDIRGAHHPPPAQETRVAVAWDSTFLYVAAQLSESNLWGTLSDSTKVVWQDNDFEVFLDPDGDTHHYFEFAINSFGTTNQIHFPRAYGDKGRSNRRAYMTGLKRGVFLDGTLNDGRDIDTAWSIELAFPWSQMERYSGSTHAPHQGEIWRMNFSRVQWTLESDPASGTYIKRPRNEIRENNWVWSPQGRIQMHIPEMWGYVRFVRSDLTDPIEKDSSARQCLLDLYYRQRFISEQTGSYALSVEELALPITCSFLTMNADSRGFIATWDDGITRTSIDHRRHLSTPPSNVRSIDLR